MFHVGQLVVRLPIAVPAPWNLMFPDPTIVGRVYTVSRSWMHKHIVLGIEYPSIQLAEFPDHAGWSIVYFRLITDDRLQIFRKLLAPAFQSSDRTGTTRRGQGQCPGPASTRSGGARVQFPACAGKLAGSTFPLVQSSGSGGFCVLSSIDLPGGYPPGRRALSRIPNAAGCDAASAGAEQRPAGGKLRPWRARPGRHYSPDDLTRCVSKRAPAIIVMVSAHPATSPKFSRTVTRQDRRSRDQSKPMRSVLANRDRRTEMAACPPTRDVSVSP